MADNLKLLKAFVNSRVALLAIGMAAAGVGFLFWSQRLEEPRPVMIWAAIIREIGGATFVTGVLTLAWDLAAKRRAYR